MGSCCSEWTIGISERCQLECLGCLIVNFESIRVNFQGVDIVFLVLTLNMYLLQQIFLSHICFFCTGEMSRKCHYLSYFTIFIVIDNQYLYSILYHFENLQLQHVFAKQIHFPRKPKKTKLVFTIVLIMQTKFWIILMSKKGKFKIKENLFSNNNQWKL